MNELKKIRRDLYFTDGHEWIDFQGSVAYIGVSSFKLKGIKEIHKVFVTENLGSKKRGERIATIQFEDYQVPVHIPVDGKVISFNDLILGNQKNLILEEPENHGWVALIVPSVLYERKGLLHPEEYKRFIAKKNKN